MITKFSQYQLVLEETYDVHSFVEMFKAPSKMFFDDVRDQLLSRVDKIIAESKYQSLINPASYYIVFEYKGKIFKMKFTTQGMSVRCYYFSVPQISYESDDEGVYIGSMSNSVGILFKKIDKFIRNNA